MTMWERRITHKTKKGREQFSSSSLLAIVRVGERSGTRRKPAQHQCGVNPREKKLRERVTNRRSESLRDRERKADRKRNSATGKECWVTDDRYASRNREEKERKREHKNRNQQSIGVKRAKAKKKKRNGWRVRTNESPKLIPRWIHAKWNHRKNESQKQKNAKKR